MKNFSRCGSIRGSSEQYYRQIQLPRIQQHRCIYWRGIGNIAIFNNDIKSNTIGVSLASSTVTLCLNNFVRNPNDVKVGSDWVTATWYCRIGNQYVGNYWEGVSDPDQCRARGDIDGVCKIVYENNIDFYPTVRPIPVPVPEPLAAPFIVLVVLSMLLFWRRR